MINSELFKNTWRSEASKQRLSSTSWLGHSREVFLPCCQSHWKLPQECLGVSEPFGFYQKGQMLCWSYAELPWLKTHFSPSEALRVVHNQESFISQQLACIYSLKFGEHSSTGSSIINKHMPFHDHMVNSTALAMPSSVEVVVSKHIKSQRTVPALVSILKVV